MQPQPRYFEPEPKEVRTFAPRQAKPKRNKDGSIKITTRLPPLHSPVNIEKQKKEHKLRQAKAERAGQSGPKKRVWKEPQRDAILAFVLHPAAPEQPMDAPTTTKLPNQIEEKRLCPVEEQHKTECFQAKQSGKLFWKCLDCKQESGTYAGMPKLLGADGEGPDIRPTPIQTSAKRVRADPDTRGTHGKSISLQDLYSELHELRESMHLVNDALSLQSAALREILAALKPPQVVVSEPDA